MTNKGILPNISFKDKSVLITGGTRGIGLDLGLAFGSLGARCVLTYRWGGHEDSDIVDQFKKVGAPEPTIVQADVINKEDTQSLMGILKEHFQSLDIFISNVSASMLIRGFDDYSLKALKKSISYSVWPLVDYFQSIEKVLGAFPKYTMAISSTGPDDYSYGYDFVASSKACVETLCKYLTYRTKRNKNVIINAIRTRAIRTQAFKETFGADFEDFIKKQNVPENYWIDCREISNAIIALCSGYCDGIQGQVINVDRGTRFFDNFMEQYTRHEKSK